MLETVTDDYGQFIDLETVEDITTEQKYNHRFFEYKPNDYYNKGGYSIFFIRIISWATITYILYRTICR